jgi:hypothetical protein
MMMVLPTGMILASSYLCHFWRAMFAPLHSFVNRSPSKPDDIAVNMLMQFLGGKGPRNFPQVVNAEGDRPVVTRRTRTRQRRRLQWWWDAKESSSSLSSLSESAGTKKHHRHEYQLHAGKKTKGSKKAARAAYQAAAHRSTPVVVKEPEPNGNVTKMSSGRRRLGMSGMAVWPM